MAESGDGSEASAAREAEEEPATGQRLPGRKRVGDPTDAVEAGVVGWVQLGEVSGMIDRGEVLGSGSITGLLRHLVAHPAGR